MIVYDFICRKKDAEGNIVAACNGCVNTKNMYKRFNHHVADCSLDDSGVSDNNGLGPTMEILEEVYTNPNFPSRSTNLKSSLKDMGISRADLWAFAVFVAVDLKIEVNNKEWFIIYTVYELKE